MLVEDRFGSSGMPFNEDGVEFSSSVVDVLSFESFDVEDSESRVEFDDDGELLISCRFFRISFFFVFNSTSVISRWILLN